MTDRQRIARLRRLRRQQSISHQRDVPVARSTGCICPSDGKKCDPACQQCRDRRAEKRELERSLQQGDEIIYDKSLSPEERVARLEALYDANTEPRDPDGPNGTNVWVQLREYAQEILAAPDLDKVVQCLAGDLGIDAAEVRDSLNHFARADAP